MVRARTRLSWLVMLIPFLVWLAVFAYAPLVGLIASFEEFSWRTPFFGAWVGFRNFRFLLADLFFRNAAMNTVFFAVVKSFLIVSVPALLAFGFRTSSRRVSYGYSALAMISYFSSWVVVSVAVRFLVSPQTWGISVGGTSFLNDPGSARWLFTLTDVLKAFGWVFFVYLLTIRSLDPDYWELAEMEGASTFQVLRYVALPLLAPVVAVMAVLTVTSVVDSSTDQALNLSNPGIYSSTDVIGSYAYRTAIRAGQIGRAAAASLVETVIRYAVVLLVFFAGFRYFRGTR